MQPTTITAAHVTAICDLSQGGLCSGKGSAIKPGTFCVQQLISRIFDDSSSDAPSCVNYAVRSFGIVLNDASWSSDQARANGLRKFAVAELGTADWTREQTH